MSMVDDTNRPHRQENSLTPGRPARPAAPAGGAANDPLAELARLIGQEDPFREMEREARALRRRESPSIAASNATADTGEDGHPADRLPPPGPGPAAGGAAPEPHLPAIEAAPPAEHAKDNAYAVADDYAAEPYSEDTEVYDHGYEEAPRRRRGGLATVAAVLVLAVAGIGSIYAYRVVMGPSRSAQAPVIKAQTEPTKIIPAAKNQAAPPKIYDRVGDRGQSDRLVPREEQPIEMRDVVGAIAARPAGSSPVAAAAGAPPRTAPSVASDQPGGASIEPKKVRTIPIRPDLSIAPRAAATNPAASAAPAPTAPRTPVASAAATAPASTASLPPTVPGGQYLVQVSSQRTEADAYSSFRMLQSRYPDVLGGRQVIVRRAELGDRGVFYRAQVGPFATAEDAQEMCENLKTAGGQCIVQRN